MRGRNESPRRLIKFPLLLCSGKCRETPRGAPVTVNRLAASYLRTEIVIHRAPTILLTRMRLFLHAGNVGASFLVAVSLEDRSSHLPLLIET